MATNRYAFSRSYSQKIHAKNRARQRYNLALSPAFAIRLAEAFRNGKGTVLERQGKRFVVYSIDLSIVDPKHEPRTVIAVYDRKTRNIVTFLPDDWTPQKGKEHRNEMKRLYAEWLNPSLAITDEKK